MPPTANFLSSAEGLGYNGAVTPVNDLSEYTGAVKEKVAQGMSPHAKPYQGESLTPFQKAKLESCSIIEHDPKADNGEGLHGAKEPFYHIQSERGEHRVMIFLKAQGHSNIEIARATGFSAVAVSNVLRQPWAQKRIVEEISLAGRDEVAQLLQGAAADSVIKLIQLRDDATGKVPPAVQKSAADAILDRVYGKPNQRFEHSYDKTAAEMSDDELERIIKQGSRGTTPAATRQE